jgi:hypothetical protein
MLKIAAMMPQIAAAPTEYPYEYVAKLIPNTRLSTPIRREAKEIILIAKINPRVAFVSKTAHAKNNKTTIIDKAQVIVIVARAAIILVH